MSYCVTCGGYHDGGTAGCGLAVYPTPNRIDRLAQLEAENAALRADCAQFCGDTERLIKATDAETVADALDAIAALRQERDALKAQMNDDEACEYIFEAGWQAARRTEPAEYQETEHGLVHSAFLAWQAREEA